MLALQRNMYKANMCVMGVLEAKVIMVGIKERGRIGKLTLEQGCQNSLTSASMLDKRVPSAPYY